MEAIEESSLSDISRLQQIVASGGLAEGLEIFWCTRIVAGPALIRPPPPPPLCPILMTVCQSTTFLTL